MPRILTDAQVRQYQQQGYVDAVPVLTPEEAVQRCMTHAR